MQIGSLIVVLSIPLHMSQAMMDTMQARKQAEKDRKEKLQRALDSGQRIIIDLDFADKMTGAELRSVCKQLAYSYSANTRAAQPGHLILTSYQASLLPCGVAQRIEMSRSSSDNLN